MKDAGMKEATTSNHGKKSCHRQQLVPSKGALSVLTTSATTSVGEFSTICVLK